MAAPSHHCAWPAGIEKTGDVSTSSASWASTVDLLADYRSHRGIDPVTGRARPMPNVAVADRRDARWAIVDAPDNDGGRLIQVAGGRELRQGVVFDDIFRDSAVDDAGREFALERRVYVSEQLPCGTPNQHVHHGFSASGRFVVCWVGNTGETHIRDRAAGWTADLGDGTVRLSDDDTYALAGPYRKNVFDEPLPTRRRSLERLRWNEEGRVESLTLRDGEPTEIFAAGQWAYAYRVESTVAFARTCDDAVIGRIPAGNDVALSFSSTGHFFLLSQREGRAVYRLTAG